MSTHTTDDQMMEGHTIVTRGPWVLPLLASVAAAIVAVVWLVAPDTYPYGSGDINRAGFNHLIEREAGAAIALTAGAVGILLAVIGLRGGAARPAVKVAGAGAVAETLCFAFVLGDGSVMAALGYLVAMTLPVTAVTVMVLVGRRWPPVGIALGAVVLILGVAGLATGGLATLGDAVATYYGNFLSDPEGYYPRMAWATGWLAGAAGWAWAAIASVRGARSDDVSGAAASRATPEAARRWGPRVTIAAALCPVPYGLARLTWVTPWPLGGNGLDEFVISRDLDTATRLQGFLFAPAVAVGVILTLGLISHWGEVFPRWVPVLSGRAVPVKLAVIPGTLVAALITIAAPGMLLGPIEERDLLALVYEFVGMPFAIWGPLLGFAVYAYWLRRTRGPDAPSTDRGADRLSRPAAEYDVAGNASATA